MTPVALVAGFHERLWRHNDEGAIEDTFAPDAVVHVASFASDGIEVIRDDVRRYRAAFTDIDSQVVHLFGDDHQAVLHWRTAGRHIGRYGKVEPTDRVIVMTGVDVFEVADGRVTECWSMWDGLDVFDQLGVELDLW